MSTRNVITHPGVKFSVKNFDLDQEDTEINHWVVNFLRESENPNIELASILADRPMLWAGPTEIDLDQLVRVGGPGMKYHEEPDVWEARINGISSSISDVRDLPPLIILAKITGEDRQLTLIVADGAHRLEALRKLGRQKAWSLVAFHSAQLRDEFLAFRRNPGREKIMTSKEMQNPYVGNSAINYESVRISQPHWHTEHEAVSKMLQKHKGKTILDAPVGTGRFLDIYRDLECSLVGLDLSEDMLAITDKKAKAAGMANVKLVQGSAAGDWSEAADVSLCVRFINLIPGEVAEQVVQNLARASREEMLIHLTSIDFSEVPASQHEIVDSDMAERYERQRQNMEFASHKLADFVGWASAAGFEIVESIECQKKWGYSRTHVHRLTRV